MSKIQKDETNRIRILFNLYHMKNPYGMGGTVYDKNYLSQTLTIMCGGNREPLILEYEKKRDNWRQTSANND